MLHFAKLMPVVIAALLCSGCVSTSLVYDPNVYHTGRTLGKKKVKANGALAMATKMRNTDDDYDLATQTGDNALNAAAGLSIGVADHTDLGGMFHLGLADDGNSIGARFFLKQRINPADSIFAISILPAVSIINGSDGTDEANHLSASSDLFSLELHFPMSYRVGKHFDFVVEPNVHFLNHKAHFSGFNGSRPYNSKDINDHWVCPGLALGMRIGAIMPEVCLLSMDGKVRASGGIGFSF